VLKVSGISGHAILKGHLRQFVGGNNGRPEPILNLKDRIFWLILIRGDQRYRSFHVKYIVPHPQEALPPLGVFKTHLDSAPNGGRATHGEASPR